MTKYRIKLHPEGYYTIQKRVYLMFWKEMWFWVRSEGLDEVYSQYIYNYPPKDILDGFNKYG